MTACPDGAIAIPCPNCGEVTDGMPSSATSWTCSSCQTSYEFQRCRHCNGVIQAQRNQRRGTCPWCGKKHKARRSAFPNASDMAEELSRQGVRLGTDDRDLRVLLGCTVIGGYGHEMPAGTRVNVRFERDVVRFVVPGGGASDIPYRDVAGLEIEGRGAIRSGGVFVGGGFGAQAAVEGMLAASVLNSLTAKTKIETIIGLRTDSWQVFLFWDRATPDALRRDLAPTFARLNAAHQALDSQAAATSVTNMAAELATLDKLHKAGSLSTAEFAEAKKRLIRET